MRLSCTAMHCLLQYNKNTIKLGTIFFTKYVTRYSCFMLYILFISLFFTCIINYNAMLRESQSEIFYFIEESSWAKYFVFLYFWSKIHIVKFWKLEAFFPFSFHTFFEEFHLDFWTITLQLLQKFCFILTFMENYDCLI